MTDEPLEIVEDEGIESEQPGLPAQAEVFRMPKRFGHVPVDDAPLGWDKEKRFEREFPRVELPFQQVERISFGHPELEPNQLFFGDNLHIMRMLPSESIDLIYIDPPFFSGRQYNLIFGDKSELRSFSDIWEGGLNGYLVWLNARLYEMKRLLKPTGVIYVHLDWHAAHYVKVEMDKIFGYGGDAKEPGFRNEIIWHYTGGGRSSNYFSRKHDSILMYTRSTRWTFNVDAVRVPYKETSGYAKGGIVAASGKKYMPNPAGTPVDDVWDIPIINPLSHERIGYPTQKPKVLIERIVAASSSPGDVVADFFVGGGTTAEVAQDLGRQWIACDISRVAVSLTADRVAKVAERTGKREVQTSLDAIPDFTISNWGIYEVDHLTEFDEAAFREFVVKAFAGRLATGAEDVHGYKEGEPLYVGSPRQDEAIGIEHVGEFAKALLRRSGTDEAKGTMLGWAFAPEAQVAVDRLLAQRKASIRFVRLKLVTLESPEFKAHVVERSPQYEHLLTFVLPPVVRFSAVRVGPKKYRFDSSESQSLNAGGSIINVQWDFDYRHYFTSSPGFEFSRKKDKLALDAAYEFPRPGKWRVACRMQDDVGGQATAVSDIEVT